MKSNKKGFFTNGFLSSFFKHFSINSVLYILASKSITFPHLVSGYYHIIRQQVEKLVLKLNSCSGWLMEWNASAAAAKAKCGNIKTCRDAELHLNCSFKQLLLVTELHFNLTTLALRHWGVEIRSFQALLSSVWCQKESSVQARWRPCHHETKTELSGFENVGKFIFNESQNAW